jgi:hypothetical protein
MLSVERPVPTNMWHGNKLRMAGGTSAIISANKGELTSK